MAMAILCELVGNYCSACHAYPEHVHVYLHVHVHAQYSMYAIVVSPQFGCMRCISSLAYPIVTRIPLIISNLPIKTLIARQWPMKFNINALNLHRHIISIPSYIFFLYSGMKHVHTRCHGCNGGQIAGILWQCRICFEYYLCTPCYMLGRHSMEHTFLRIDTHDVNRRWAKRAFIAMIHCYSMMIPYSM